MEKQKAKKQLDIDTIIKENEILLKQIKEHKTRFWKLVKS